MKEYEQIILSNGYLNPKQAAAYLGIGIKTLADYRSKGRLPHFIKRRNAITYHAWAIIQFIQHRNKTKSMPQ